MYVYGHNKHRTGDWGRSSNMKRNRDFYHLMYSLYHYRYLRKALTKGVPPLFVDLKPLYEDSEKVEIIEGLVHSYLENLKGELYPPISFHSCNNESGDLNYTLPQAIVALMTLRQLRCHLRLKSPPPPCYGRCIMRRNITIILAATRRR